MIDWVHERCLEWASQCRELGVMDPANLSAYEHIPFRLTESAQDVSHAVCRMRGTLNMELPHTVLIAHYLASGTVKIKLHALGIDKFTYWRTGLHAAHCFLAARIEQPLRRSA